MIKIDIPNREITLSVDDDELNERRNEMETRGNMAYRPQHRTRVVSTALKTYAALASSADKGGVRDLAKLP